MSMKLTKNFSLSEFTRSSTAESMGFSNDPTQEHLLALQALATATLQPIRELVNVPVTITSGYRSTLLNRAIGGVATSQHSKGEACDFQVEGNSKKGLLNIAKKIRDSGIPFDQLIFEDKGRGSWIHISYSRLGDNRRECLTATFDNDGKASYTAGL